MPVTYKDGVAQAPADMQLIVPPVRAPSVVATALQSTFNGAVWLARSQAGSIVISAAIAYYCPAYAAMIVRNSFYPAFDLATRIGFSTLPQSGLMGIAARMMPQLTHTYLRWAAREHATQLAMLNGGRIMAAVGYVATQAITNGPTVLRITYNSVASTPGAVVATGSAAVTAVSTVASGLAAATRSAANLTISAATATYSVGSSIASGVISSASYLRSWFSGRTTTQDVPRAVALITAPELALIEAPEALYIVMPLASIPDTSFERSQHPSTRQLVLYRGPRTGESQQIQNPLTSSRCRT